MQAAIRTPHEIHNALEENEFTPRVFRPKQQMICTGKQRQRRRVEAMRHYSYAEHLGQAEAIGKRILDRSTRLRIAQQSRLLSQLKDMVPIVRTPPSTGQLESLITSIIHFDTWFSHSAPMEETEFPNAELRSTSRDFRQLASDKKTKEPRGTQAANKIWTLHAEAIISNFTDAT